MRAARWVRRNIGLAAWAFLFVVVVLGAGQQHLNHHGWPSLRPKAQLLARLDAKAQRTIEDIERFAVPGLRINRVSAGFLSEGVAGTFRSRNRSITLAVGLEEHGETVYFATACHEVVHAMFEQIDAHGYWAAENPWALLLKEETACDVLGAHIAGTVWSWRGKDGTALTRELVREHRECCDPKHPRSYYQKFARARATYGERAVDEDWEYMISLHYGSPEVVDEMDRICRENPDAWKAARVIRDRFLVWEDTRKSIQEIIEEGG
jgi:hypothetical protein